MISPPPLKGLLDAFEAQGARGGRARLRMTERPLVHLKFKKIGSTLPKRSSNTQRILTAPYASEMCGVDW